MAARDRLVAPRSGPRRFRPLRGCRVPVFAVFALGTAVARSRLPALLELAGVGALLFGAADTVGAYAEILAGA